MSPITEFFTSGLRALAIAGIVVAGLVALFVAWWIALAALLCLVIYLAVRRMLPRKPGEAQRGAPAVIEGEFRIEREDPPHLGER